MRLGQETFQNLSSLDFRGRDGSEVWYAGYDCTDALQALCLCDGRYVNEGVAVATGCAFVDYGCDFCGVSVDLE
jgi:hypothetical protein